MVKDGVYMQLPFSDELEIKYLSRLFDNKSECYKLFWFQAIVTKVEDGKDIITYEELVNEMIADAWYMVSEYHLNLGPNDTLEKVIKRINAISTIKSSETKANILKYLQECTDGEVQKYKKVLTLNVPYRLQAPFMVGAKSDVWKCRGSKLGERINQERRLMYYFGAFQGMQTQIRIQPGWMEYIRRNREILRGWIQFNMITYLQRRNPSVPGIADKLYPPQERKMEKVKKFWRLVMELQPVHEIYMGIELQKKDMSIDHFVPWSYVAHDEFWNLHPTTRSINSKKSNYLPDWEMYFHKLCQIEYKSYELMWKNEKVHKTFVELSNDHLNNYEIRQNLYREGLSEAEFSGQLADVISPVYQSAKNAGFMNWVLDYE